MDTLLTYLIIPILPRTLYRFWCIHENFNDNGNDPSSGVLIVSSPEVLSSRAFVLVSVPRKGVGTRCPPVTVHSREKWWGGESSLVGLLMVRMTNDVYSVTSRTLSTSDTSTVSRSVDTNSRRRGSFSGWNTPSSYPSSTSPYCSYFSATGFYQTACANSNSYGLSHCRRSRDDSAPWTMFSGSSDNWHSPTRSRIPHPKYRVVGGTSISSKYIGR